MITSWPRDLPGPGVNARRLAERITAMSGGRLAVQLYAAGELVPGLQVLDGVNAGVAEMGHTAAIYWTGKTRAAAYFTTVPWGFTPLEHVAWIEHGGGQALWDELYAPFGLKPFMAGNSGMQMGGWFKRELKGLADLKGLKVRAVGLSADLYQRLGAVGVVLQAGDIFPALQSGAIDGVEFLGPNSDRAQGFYQVAPYYYWPTFTKPNGTAECIIRRDAWDKLEPGLRAIVENACRAENQVTLARERVARRRGARGPDGQPQGPAAPLARGHPACLPPSRRGGAGHASSRRVPPRRRSPTPTATRWPAPAAGPRSRPRPISARASSPDVTAAPEVTGRRPPPRARRLAAVREPALPPRGGPLDLPARALRASARPRCCA